MTSIRRDPEGRNNNTGAASVARQGREFPLERMPDRAEPVVDDHRTRSAGGGRSGVLAELDQLLGRSL
jgi:hypothetical protein